jgi:hypothetical protein
VADDASTRFHNKIQTQLTQHVEYLVESQSWLALLERMNEACRHASKSSKLVLVESELEPPPSNFLAQYNKTACTIVHIREPSSSIRSALEDNCTIVHSVVGLASDR